MPVHPLREPETYYRSVLLRIILHIIIVATVFALLTTLLFRPDFVVSIQYELINYGAALIGYSFAYWLMLRDNYNLSAFIMLLVITLFGFALVLPNVLSPFAAIVALIALFTSGLLLPPRYTMSLICFNVIMFFLFHYNLGGVHFVDIFTGPILFMVGVGAIIIANHWYQHKVRAARLAIDQKYERLFTTSRNALAVLEGEYIVEANPLFTEWICSELAHRPLPIHEVFGEISISLRHMLYEKNIGPVEFDVPMHRGDTFPASVTLSPIDDSGFRFLLSVRDITLIKQNEETRLQLELQNERVRLLEDFIGDASHDLKTPLSVMGTSLYLLKRMHNIPDDDRHLLSLQKQINHMTRLFDDLLSLARLDRTYNSLKMARYNINLLVQIEVTHMEEYATQKEQRLEFLPSPHACWLNINATEMSRAVHQLLTNAIKYTPPGGKIIACVYPDDDGYVIEVRDNGIGIELEEIPNLFKRFYRADKARSSETGGMGLGLSIVQRIMEAHDGKVTVESTPQKGSTFRLHLPVKSAQAAASQVHQPPVT